MGDILSFAAYLFSTFKNALFATAIRPISSPEFAASNSNKLFLCFQMIRKSIQKTITGKQFPLKTVIGPYGFITYC